MPTTEKSPDEMPTTEKSPDKMPTFGWHFVRVAFCPTTPPGPTGLPLLGNLAMLDPGAPYETLASLVPKYGKVLGLETTW